MKYGVICTSGTVTYYCYIYFDSNGAVRLDWTPYPAYATCYVSKTNATNLVPIAVKNLFHNPVAASVQVIELKEDQQSQQATTNTLSTLPQTLAEKIHAAYNSRLRGLYVEEIRRIIEETK